MTLVEILACGGLDAASWSAVAAVASALAAIVSAGIAYQQKQLTRQQTELGRRQLRVAHLQAQAAMLEPRLRVHRAAVDLTVCVMLDLWGAGEAEEERFAKATVAFVAERYSASALFESNYLGRLQAVEAHSVRYSGIKRQQKMAGQLRQPQEPLRDELNVVQEEARRLLTEIEEIFEAQARVVDEAPPKAGGS